MTPADWLQQLEDGNHGNGIHLPSPTPFSPLSDIIASPIEGSVAYPPPSWHEQSFIYTDKQRDVSPARLVELVETVRRQTNG